MVTKLDLDPFWVDKASRGPEKISVSIVSHFLGPSKVFFLFCPIVTATFINNK